MCPEISQEDFDKLSKIKAQEETRAARSKVYREKRNHAVKTLIENHRAEYDEMMA